MEYVPLYCENTIIQTWCWNTNDQVHTSTSVGINAIFMLPIPSVLRIKNIQYGSVTDTLATSHRKMASSLQKARFRMFRWHLKLAFPTLSFLSLATYSLRWKGHTGNMGHWFSVVLSSPISMGCTTGRFS